MKFSVIVDITFRQDSASEFMALLRDNRRSSLDGEAGCEVFDILLGNGADSETRVVLYEVYTSEADFERHLVSSHYRRFDAATAGMIASKAVQRFRLDP